MSRGRSLSCSGGQPEYGCKRASFVSLWRHWFPQLPSLRLAVVRLSPASASGVHSRRSSVVATLRSCRRCGCVPRGQRALLEADMLELIDRSACLVEPVSVVESCAPPPVLVLSPAASTSSAASGRCSRIPPPRGLVEGLLLPESSLRAAPVASLRLLLLDDRDLSLFCHVAKRCVTLFLDVLLHVLHLGSHPACLNAFGTLSADSVCLCTLNGLRTVRLL